jgi:hypothetical protein
MDLNVKLQGLKYNFGKVWGCHCKNTAVRIFSELNKLFSYRKMRRPSACSYGPSPPARRTGPRALHKTVAVDLWTDDSD